MLLLTVAGFSQTAQEKRVAEIQTALQEQKLDGWLFYDFRGSDILTPRILNVERIGGTRRWFYYVPAKGDPIKVVHAIEPGQLDGLPGEKKLVYLEWQQLKDRVAEAMFDGKKTGNNFRIAMQYSPNNDIPYISRVDAGTIEMVRSLGVNIVTSADLVQQFEAVWTPEQFELHKKASQNIQKIIIEVFAEIKRRINADIPTTEIDVQQYMMERYKEYDMRSSPMIVAVNANAASPHYFPRANRHSPIKRGDLVLIDAVSKMNAPRAPTADLTWMGYVGETVPEEYTKIWDIVFQAQQTAFKFVQDAARNKRPITGAEVDDVSRGIIKKAGFGEYFIHRTGHSIGEEGHGNGANIDNLETRDSRRLMPGTAFSIEPGIYFPERFGIRSEINVYFGEDDAIITAPHQTEIFAILK